MLLILCTRCCCSSSSPDCCGSTLRASWLAVDAWARAPCGENLSLQGNAGRRNARRVCWCCAVWGECLWQVHCRVWDPTCVPRGDDCRNALWRCHCCNTATPVRCVFERRKPLWTHWAHSLWDANYVVTIFFSCSHRMQRNRLHIITPYLNSQRPFHLFWLLDKC